MTKEAINVIPLAYNANPTEKAGVGINANANTKSANMIAIVMIKILSNTTMILRTPDTMIL